MVGPRPEQVEFAQGFAEAIPFYSYRHLVKPGITGWVQVIHGCTTGGEQAHRRLEYDLSYVKHCSFWFDAFIAIKTIKTVLTRFGAR